MLAMLCAWNSTNVELGIHQTSWNSIPKKYIAGNIVCEQTAHQMSLRKLTWVAIKSNKHGEFSPIFTSNNSQFPVPFPRSFACTSRVTWGKMFGIDFNIHILNFSCCFVCDKKTFPLRAGLLAVVLNFACLMSSLPSQECLHKFSIVNGMNGTRIAFQALWSYLMRLLTTRRKFLSRLELLRVLFPLFFSHVWSNQFRFLRSKIFFGEKQNVNFFPPTRESRYGIEQKYTQHGTVVERGTTSSSVWRY